MNPFEHVQRFFDDLVARYGYDHRAIDYGGPEKQQLRFEVLASVMPLDGLRVLDVGCGFGDYASFLEKRFENVQYVGIDIAPKMIETGRQQRSDLDLRLVNILNDRFDEQFDVVTANGVFYLFGDDAQALMEKMIKRMFELARRAVVFTSLSSWASKKEPGEFHADPLETLNFCRRLTSKLVLRTDYHPGDFSVFLYK